jgi:hypothetical protein
MFDTFCMWMQHVACPAMVKGEDRIHDQNGGDLNRYVSSRDIGDRQNTSRVSSLRWSWALEADHGPSPPGGFAFFWKGIR